MSIVMGVDQHRAQITAEWIDLATGEISRARVLPADRAGVRRFLGRFAGEQLEVALEATTGWRFVVEELREAGAVVHLARADARHHRELLLAGRRRTPPVLWPLVPGFGCAVQRPVPPRSEPPTTNLQPFARAKPSVTPTRRGRLPNDCCRHATRVYRLERSSGRNASPRGITPSNISSPIRSQPRIEDQSKPGRPRAKPDTHTPAAQARPTLTPGGT